VPAQHFSSRGLFDRNKKLWAGFVFEGLAGPVYFAGDTGLGPQFRQIADRFGEIRLALLPIGAFLPRWFMSPTHLSPSDALEAHFILGAQTSVAMHFGTFQLGDDGQYEAVDLLSATIAETSMEDTEFLVLDSGEGRDFLPVTDYAQIE
jgi:L-ascorbate metabolism protein UlaG (beta-lactamase superfamily)